MYQLDFSRVGHKIEVIDFYTKWDSIGQAWHLWVTTDYMAPHLTPDFGRTVVFFHQQDKEKYFNPLQYKEKERPNLVEWNQVIFNHKENSVSFGLKGFWIFKKPILKFTGNIRYYGNKMYNKKVVIDHEEWYYDFGRDRLILVINK